MTCMKIVKTTEKCYKITHYIYIYIYIHIYDEKFGKNGEPQYRKETDLLRLV